MIDPRLFVGFLVAQMGESQAPRKPEPRQTEVIASWARDESFRPSGWSSVRVVGEVTWDNGFI